ncbi:MAG: phosphatase PAP2 family protein [Burkholderiales bacterium]|nr:MAG: phosphatase PAP2 family protein [Betaproteobacteria bacterium]TAG83173.1 MAG: phosphatase PAP2 family protein [Burkholderiales bacterium]
MCVASFGALQAEADTEREIGDVLSYAMPAAVLGYELYRGDKEGALQFTTSFAATTLATEVLKRTTKVERPDRTNDLSFPSGHAARAFSAASYIHRRHGWEYALPAYALATYVGQTRVQAKRHRWGDIAGAVAVSTLATWWLVDPKSKKTVAITPLYDGEFAGLMVAARFR